MRKIISLGLFAFMLSVFSSQVFAGSADACEPLKKDKSKPGLFGLCVAWHNADDQAKDKIADNYFKKSGGFTVPGADVFDCICWNDLSYAEVCDIANSPTARPIPGTNAITFLDKGLQMVTGFGAGATSCVSYTLDITPPPPAPILRDVELLGLPPAESATCIAEVQVISTFRNNEVLCPSD